ncbi:MAG TPA: signal peptidase II, partial [Nitrospiria bacterium]|nr:signal peptidase II [Nitrospiria bacterium]
MSEMAGSGKKSFKTYFFIGLIIGGIILADQVTKTLIARSFGMHESMEVIRHFFNLTYTRNPGAAFGFLSDERHGFRVFFFP